jgi:hypothetical protein
MIMILPKLLDRTHDDNLLVDVRFYFSQTTMHMSPLALVNDGVRQCVCVCVCVCLTSSREGLPSRNTNRRAITPLNACNVVPPPDSAHQPLPGEMLAGGGSDN